MMLNHLFYRNPTTFGNYILILKEVVSLDDFIAIFENKNRRSNRDQPPIFVEIARYRDKAHN